MGFDLNDIQRMLRKILKEIAISFVASRTKLNHKQATLVWDTTSDLVKEAEGFSDMTGGEKRDWVKTRLKELAAIAISADIIEDMVSSDVNWIIETVLLAVLR